MARTHAETSPAARIWLALFCLTAIFGGSLVHSQAPFGDPERSSVVFPEELAAPQAAPGQEMVVGLEIIGNRVFTQDRIIRNIHTRAGRPYDEALVAEDVRRLNNSRMFMHVEAGTRQAPDGRIVVFRVVERPILHYVRYVGCEKVNKTVLEKEVNLKANEAMDPYAVVEGKRKIEEFYRGKGFGRVHVTIFEGDKAEDRGAVYIINEGPKQRVWATKFEGNAFASDGRLKTQIKSKPGFFWVFRGEVDRNQIEEDKNRLVAYYRSMGFFQAQVGVEPVYNEAGDWLTLSFVIDEGPRYHVRNIAVMGNQVVPTNELTNELKLTVGKPFNQSEMTADVTRMQDRYGAVGYVFANVKAQPRFLEEPGQIDLVYNITEGEPYRVALITPKITGENPHTKITTILDRLSFAPGQLVDTRELRASERRLKSSQLFANDPVRGVAPKITFTPQQLKGLGEADGEESVVERPQQPERPVRQAGFRGQSPDPEPQAPLWQPSPRYAASNTTTAPSSLPANPTWPQPQPSPFAAAPAPAASQSLPPLNASRPGYYAEQPRVAYRDQGGAYDPNAGTALPSLSSNPYAVAQPVAPAPGPAFSAPGPAAYPQTNVTPAPEPGLVQNWGMTPVPGGPLGPMPPPPLMSPPLDLEITPTAEETMTGRFMLSVGVNSELGLVGSIVVDEQNFDWTRWPRSWEEVVNGQALRGNGERFRFEAMPGTQLQRYTASWTNPYAYHLIGMDISQTLSAFYYDRRYEQWTERRAGGRFAWGAQLLPDLWATFAYRLEDIHVGDPQTPPGVVPDIDEVLGANTLHGLRFQLTRDTRDSTFMATEGYLWQVGFEQVLGSFSYPRADIDFRKYFLMRQHPDGSGRHVLALSSQAAISGEDTPVYDRFFLGGFSTLRGFEFRGVSPRVSGVAVGGEFSLSASAEYMFPITADDVLRGVVFLDSGTVQREITEWDEAYRVAVGAGLRITIPAMGPAPIALDFAVPLVKEPYDETQVFSFFVGFLR